MWSAKNVCVCCMCKSQDYKKINEIEVSYGPLRVYEILYKTVPPMEHINKQNPDQFSLPEIICLTCYDSLLRAYKFQEQCLASIQRLYRLWAEHQLETPIALDKLQTRDEIKLEIEVESPCVQNGYEIQKYVYYNKDAEKELQKLPPEKEVNADVLGEDVDATDGFDSSDEEFLVVEKKNPESRSPENKSPENKSPENNSPENKISRPNFENRRSGNYPCDDCGKIFGRKYSLLRHSSVHSLERPYDCNKCKYRFATPQLLKAHMVLHEKGTNVTEKKSRRKPKQLQPDRTEATCSCMVCGTGFNSAKSLKMHTIFKHPEVELHKCDKCDKTFVLHAHMLEHLKRHSTRNFICVICQRDFLISSNLKVHMRTHTGETPYLCTRCGKSFRSSNSLRNHMEIHENLRKYKCTDCPSRFNGRADLIKHFAIHSKDKPHVCDVCGSKFARSTSLRKHKELHTGLRPYKCDQCNMTFATKYTLRRHERTHTGEKPQKCKFCDRAYSEYGDLTKHLRTHVGKNTYMCDECPMAFKYQSELKQHQSEHFKAAKKLLEQTQNQSQEVQDQTIKESQQLPSMADADHHDIGPISEEIPQKHSEISGAEKELKS